MDMGITEIIIAVVASVMASSGFWALLQYYISKKDNSNKLLLGLAHDRIMFLGTFYLERGYMTPDEYENLMVYLYEPYIGCGGNGSVQHIVEKVRAKVEIQKQPTKGSE